jgi:hypothetical protein
MGLDFSAAYQQIKNLENSGKLTLPETQDTQVVGTIDPAAGTFTWSVPTVIQTITLPPPPGQKTNIITNITVGIVNTKAVDFLLKFAVIPQKAKAVAHALDTSKTSSNVKKVIGVGIESALGETNGGVTITGFPTVSSLPTAITVDAGLACSTVIEEAESTTTPPINRFGVTINIPGHDSINIWLFILRPPAVALGAFTIPALPVTIVYAPPQGKLLKNTMTYSDTSSLSRTVSSSITTSNSVKSAQAYSAADIIGKVASAITLVAAVVGTGGAGAAGGASVAGALSELGTALFGPAKTANDSTADATKQISSELSLVSNILNSVDSQMESDNSALTVQDDHSITLTITSMSQYQSEANLGPGVGDRIVYMFNVKVVWMVVNGEVGIHILGYEKDGVNSVQDFVQEEASINSGAEPILGFDVTTIKALLALDPLYNIKKLPNIHVGAPVIAPPRYVPASPPGYTGTGTGSGGDVKQISVDTSTDQKETTTHIQTTITDAKPGWLSVLFGADDVETTQTSTFTTSNSTDEKTDEKITCTVTFFSQGIDDKYDVKNFHDILLGTFLVVDSNSPALQGTSGVLESSTLA